ncbi:sigma-54-dependent Fis family transcriptional regulator [Paraflavitalea soli]|uniref:Sigma-54-dependent Fis family transcriptional regulator n=1 Tax=Paraflavitalea soli TaxID=2315862 RepID=A0A3B7MRR0_9BACT|nr:sigma-54 dependent transcriptional regulator [Paraflavitalea soli]AXY74295.1 sigma-54-dependent Fis family transcriptional regulator [Paraflavitalea soli]
MSIRILIVEDQFIEANNLKHNLLGAGYEVCSIGRSVPIALTIIEKEKPDLVLLDIFLQGPLTGIDLARTLEKKNIPFVYLSANSNKDVLDAAKSTRPYGFLVKPFRKSDVLVMLDVAWYLHQEKLVSKAAEKAAEKPAPSPQTDEAIGGIIGGGAAHQELLKSIRIVAPSNTSVLIVGENGTGKERVAQAIHQSSPRAKEPFVIVNCGALPANLIESELFGHEKGAFTGALQKRIGKFEQADGGTIFLDEIGELPPDAQVKFLRVLQEREIESIGGRVKKVNVRIIAATNRDLEQEVAVSRFRVDLYYRLNVFPLRLLPLRERKDDIEPLARHFLKIHARQAGKTINSFSKGAIQTLLQYSWPGNVRELQNIVERTVLLTDGPEIDQISLSVESRRPADNVTADARRIKTMEENERDHIIAVLEKCNWKISGKGGAAELLDINANTLTSRMKKLGIEKSISVRRNDE